MRRVRSQSRRAFSLLEVLIGSLIIAVIGVAALNQSTRVPRFTSEHTSSIFLTQKVVDDVTQAMLDNPYADLELAESNGVRKPVRDRGHPLFTQLEDTVAPWGRLDPQTDLAVDASDGDLLAAYGQLSVTWVLMPDVEAGGLLTLGLSLDWPSDSGLNRDEEHMLGFVKPRLIPPVGSMMPADPAATDRELERIFFPASANADLDAAARSAGASADEIRAAGRVALPLRRVIDELAKNPPAAASDAAGLLARARFAEAQGAWIVQAALTTTLPARELARRGVGSLGTGPARTLRALARRAASFPADLDYRLALAIDGYVRAAITLATSGRPYRRLAVERRVAELAKLRWLIKPGAPGPFLADWVAYMDRTYRGRDRGVEAYVRREATLAASRSAMENANPALSLRIQEIGQGLASLTALEGALRK